MKGDKDLTKAKVVETLISELTTKLDRLQIMYDEANRASIEADGKMQSRYDTAKEEWAATANSYMIAMNRAREAIRFFQNLDTNEVSRDGKIKVGSFARIEDDQRIEMYFISEKVGGTKVEAGEAHLTVVSVSSPVGQVLMGRSAGESVTLASPSGSRQIHILEVV